MATTLFNQLIPVDALTFDNIDYLRISPRIRVTSHPVELGSEISDHAQDEPLQLMLRGRITATPLLVPKPGAIELAQSWFERNTGQLVTLNSSRGIFTNLMFERYDSVNEGRQEAVFDVALKYVRIALAVSVPIPPRTPAPPLQAGAASAASAGVQPPIPATPSASMLATAVSFLPF